MKKIYSYLLIIFSMTSVMAQNFPADGIGYQAMLSESSKVTYGTILTNVPVANKDIKVRFELIQSGGVMLTDEHTLTTDLNGIFSCIIGTGNVSPSGQRLSDINWGADSVLVRVNIDKGEGFELFSEQKLWSTAYAQFANVARYASSDNDTSAINELQYLTLVGDSIKLTGVSGGISIKPLNDAIAKNTSDIAAEKIRAEDSEQTLQNQISTLDNNLNKKGDELSNAKDSIIANQQKIDANKTDISSNKTNISTNTSDISKLNDSAKVYRTEISKNTGAINNNTSDIDKNKTDISSNKTNISTNTSDISKLNDSAKVYRTEISKNTDARIKNAADLAQHVADDKDLDNTNELSDLVYNTTTHELSLSNPKTNGNKVVLSGVSGSQDNLGNHTATDTLDLNGQVLTDNSGDTLLIAVAGNGRDLAIESEDEIYIRTINNPNNTTNGDIQLESSNAINITAEDYSWIYINDFLDISSEGIYLGSYGSDGIYVESDSKLEMRSTEDFDIRGNTNLSVYANDLMNIYSSDLKISGWDLSFSTYDSMIFTSEGLLELSTNKGKNISVDSDNDIELKTTAYNYVEIWNDGSFMYTLPNKRGTIGQFLQRSTDGTSEYFTDWSNYKLPTSDGTNGQFLVTDGSGSVTWQSPSGGGATKLDDLSDVKGPTTGFDKSLLIGTTTTGTLTGASQNVGIGHLVMSKLNSGDWNTVVGAEALQNLSSGSSNIALGYRAAQNITTSSNNVVIGHEAAQASTNSVDNTIIGYRAMQSSSGLYDTKNVAIGSEALKKTQSGENVAIGYQSLMNFTTGSSPIGGNTAVGSNTGKSLITGYYNSIFGLESQSSNIIGYNNSSFGANSLRDLTSGYSNCAFGCVSAFKITTGYLNTAMGYQSLYQNTTGNYNVAIGASSLFNTTSSYNVAVGTSALQETTTGGYNTAIGDGAGVSNTTGYSNTFIGNRAGGTMTVGFNNTYIGYHAESTSNNVSNEIVLGDLNVTELYTAADMNAPTFTTTSDRRLKKNIQPLGSTLDKVKRLNPVIYDKKRHMTSENYDIHEIGFIAQDLQEEFPEVVSQQADEKHTLGVNYQALIPVLTKAMQEQQVIIESQQKAIENLKKRLQILESQ